MRTSQEYGLIYDGQCPLCRRSVRLIKRLDWRGRIRPLDLHTQGEEIDRRAGGLSHEVLMEAMHLVTPAGRVFAGFLALRRAAWVLPPTWLILPILYLPGVSRLGTAVYGRIARGRYAALACPPGGACRR
ncbi:MAG: DUF393 domain-containing protein [Phycisphaerae bacterium]|jgi:predicted DCC family thiol-disulfide oxidoreductase YuxK